ncbi:Ktr system potassium uptake protein KtrB [Mobilicoccus pelagius NBRC 104925]|uniref:Ktr system potassium uptake protein KtrB n=1 Tax=Mobilicoccus pelagius NBRC 104925 TaxID=1089455 RepID=H5UPL4_9MICO|nr:Ktr system potassium uptake protein KtrB [Mobilicoccus pelagius NBRC 104925]
MPSSFLAVIVVGTLLLSLPIAHASGRTNHLAAAFTAVSAVCVTGLVTVDTATYWTPFGQAIILLLIQVGGLGTMTLATLLVLLIRGRITLVASLRAQSETKTMALGDVRRVLVRIVRATLVAESSVALWLTIRFRTTYDDDLPTALWHGVFHAVSAFNNAGFALYSDNLVGFVSDGWIIAPICLSIIAGGFGYPAFFELARHGRQVSRWSIYLRLTVVGYTALFVVGLVVFLLSEWDNPGTLGPLDMQGKIWGGIAGAVFPRTAGFNAIDYGDIRPETLVVNLVLMFIGGGSAGTAGGIKVTTFFLLGYVIWSETRGWSEVRLGHRRISGATQRQALTVALLGVGLVTSAVIALVVLTDHPLDRVVFEVVSAFGTVGLSMNLTPQLPPSAQLVIMGVMFCGRVGTVTVASALALSRARTFHYHLPEEHTIVG